MMNTQMTTIEVDQNSATILRMLLEKARSQGTTLDALLKPLTEEENGTAISQEAQPPEEGMLAVLARSRERWKKMRVSDSTEDSLKILRQGRAGEMYGAEGLYQRSSD
ncbi:MAG TPA: hypothetical protein PLD20_10980 [Blastocatellia bacterium]|nr:hypothetical protein [Blastocatellia bacterium]HMV85188.1 hypothetical protein [Blastocatellia bacterium]HMX24799.1 hypothetical protein [Blastocatellia bacterium]HMY73520.1 hypothetical protein [Blastocatellia bacterium]HMZ18445.1 hypothetical protein [Blastocatellia bacterium]